MAALKQLSSSSLLLVLLFSTCAFASNIFEESYDTYVASEDGGDAEARTGNLFTSNGQYFVALNTSQLLLYAALFGAGLLAALAIASLFQPADTGYGHEQSSGYGGGSGGGEHAHGYRAKRFAASFDHGKRTWLWSHRTGPS